MPVAWPPLHLDGPFKRMDHERGLRGCGKRMFRYGLLLVLSFAA